MSLPSWLLFLPSSSPSTVPLCLATTSVSWVRSPWCQAGLQGRIGGGGEALYSAGWCGSSLFPPPLRPSWNAAMRNTIEWCLNLCGPQAVGHSSSAIVCSGWQQPASFLQNPLISHSQGQILCSCAVCQRHVLSKTAEARQTRRVSEWSVLTRSTTVPSWIQAGHKWILLKVKSWNNNCSHLHSVLLRCSYLRIPCTTLSFTVPTGPANGSKFKRN